MTMEASLIALVQPLCSQVFPDFAPVGTLPPYVIYQGIGGQPLRYTEGTAASLRHTLLQVEVWSDRRAQALQLARALEDALSTTQVFVARPASEPTNLADEDLPRYGCRQDFEVWATR